MEQRALGRSGISVPPIIFGGNVFGWTVDQAASFRLLDACVDSGLVAIDTADVYSYWVPGHVGGELENVIGAWLKARPGVRDKVLILTKCGMEMPNQGKGLAPAWIRTSVDNSLKRMGIERIDLFQSHRDDESTPLEDTLGTYKDLIAAGKISAIGASNYSAPRLKLALETSAKHGLPRYETLQPLYNLMERGIEADLVPLCVEHGVGIIPYYSLASGFLSGKYRSRGRPLEEPARRAGPGEVPRCPGHAGARHARRRLRRSTRRRRRRSRSPGSSPSPGSPPRSPAPPTSTSSPTW